VRFGEDERQGVVILAPPRLCRWPTASIDCAASREATARPKSGEDGASTTPTTRLLSQERRVINACDTSGEIVLAAAGPVGSARPKVKDPRAGLDTGSWTHPWHFPFRAPVRVSSCPHRLDACLSTPQGDPKLGAPLTPVLRVGTCGGWKLGWRPGVCNLGKCGNKCGNTFASNPHFNVLFRACR
jgi:hypothetical protein